jgi:hypothetical protein
MQILNFQEIDVEALRIVNMCYERAKEVKYLLPDHFFFVCIALREQSHNPFFHSDSAAKPKAYGCCGR